MGKSAEEVAPETRTLPRPSSATSMPCSSRLPPRWLERVERGEVGRPGNAGHVGAARRVYRDAVAAFAAVAAQVGRVEERGTCGVYFGYERIGPTAERGLIGVYNREVCRTVGLPG